MRAAYVFGPWTMSSDRPDFAYRSAPREDDRAEVWLHTPDDGSEPYWAGCFGGSDCFNLHGAGTFEQARRALDQRIVLAGHYLAERAWAGLDHWQAVATVAREIDAQHRGGGSMHDDDLVDVIVRALKDFPGLVRERDRLQDLLDAETGRKGRPGWEWLPNHGGGQLVLHVEGAHAFLNTPTRPGDGRGHPVVFVFNGMTTNMYRITDALQGMEHAEDLLRSLGRLPPKG